MKVLEIHPDYCWSFQAENAFALSILRAATRIADEGEREKRLAEIKSGSAYLFVGDALNIEFATHFFDEINVDERVSPVKATLLRPRTRQWIAPGGVVNFRSAEEAKDNNSRHLPLRARMFRMTLNRWSPSHAVS